MSKSTKYSFIIYFIIILLNFNVCSKEKETIAVIREKKGVFLKGSDNLKSNSIVKIPYKSEVKILTDEWGIIKGNTDNIKNITGKWIKVSYKKYEGWIFNGFLEKPESEYKHLLNLYKKEGGLKVLTSIPWNYTILLWKNKIIKNGDPIGFLTNSRGKLFCDTGAGFSGIELIDIKDNSSGVIFTVKSSECNKTKDYNDRPPDCLEWKITTYKYELKKDLLLEIIKGRYGEYDLTSSVLKVEYSKNLN